MRLTDDSTGIDQKASFAPEGKTIIFNRTALPPNSNATSSLWTMNADGSAAKQLSNFIAFDAWPRYSPDGRQVVFQRSSVGSDGPFDIAVMAADGSSVRTVAANTADDEFPDWQPIAQPVLPGVPSQSGATAGNSWAKVSWTAPTYDGGAPGLGVSGSGDVLAGIVGGLLARGAEPLNALQWAVWLHGEAGTRLATKVGPVGFLARQIADEVPALLPR